MTVSATVTVKQYPGTGANTDLPTVFPFFVATDFVVTQRVSATGVDTTMVQGVHYTVTGGSASGAVGTVTPMNGASDFTSAVVWTISRTLPLSQSLDYQENDPFPAASHEQGLDRLTMQSQDRSSVVARSLRFPEGDSSSLVSQLPDAVSRASKALTFDSAGNAVMTNPATASGTTVTATGSTAARTLQERFAEVFNVKDFGAIGDGVINDVIAINLAISAANSAGGGTVYFPAGTYAVAASSGSVSILAMSNVWIRGAGINITKLVLSNSSDAHVINCEAGSNTNITISDLSIDGNASNQSVQVHGIRVASGGTDILIYNIHIKEAYHYSIGFQSVISSFLRCRVHHAYLEDSGGDGIDLKDPLGTNDGIQFSDIIVDQWGLISTASQAGIDCRGIVQLANIECINNNHTTSANTGIRLRTTSVASPHDGARQSNLTNFYVQGTATNGRGVTIGGNYCTVSNGFCEMTGANARGVQIEGNTFGNATGNIVSNVGSLSSGNQAFTITDYSVENVIDSCFSKSGGGIDFRVEGGTHVNNNIIKNCVSISSSGAAGYQCDTLADRTTFKGNFVSGSAIGVNMASGVTNSVVTGTIYESCTTNLSDSGTNTVIGLDEVEQGVTIPTAAADSSALSIPYPADFFTIPGPTAVTSIASAGAIKGRRVTIKATGNVTITDVSTINLVGSVNYTMTADDTLSLICDGTNWYEIARSVN